MPSGVGAMASSWCIPGVRVVMSKGFPAAGPLLLGPLSKENGHYLMLILSHILLRVDIIPFCVKHKKLCPYNSIYVPLLYCYSCHKYCITQHVITFALEIIFILKKLRE